MHSPTSPCTHSHQTKRPVHCPHRPTSPCGCTAHARFIPASPLERPSRPPLRGSAYLRPRIDLIDGILRDAVRHQAQHVLGQLRVGLSEPPHRGEASLGAGRPLDQVSAQREWQAHKAQHGGIGAGELQAQPRQNLSHKVTALLGLERHGGHLGEGVAGANRVDRDGTALGDGEIHAHRRQRPAHEGRQRTARQLTPHAGSASMPGSEYGRI
eukprot:scaffold12373_cov97-Isochrysis_galbana.AAC.2